MTKELYHHMEKQSIEKFEQANQHSLDFFSRLIAQKGDEHHTVGYSKISHLRRYEKMLAIGDLHGKSILDIGCGLAGFYSFLQEQGIEADYYGIDINPKMIELARERHPGIRDHFEVFDIIGHDYHRKFDYCIAIGILNLNFANSVNNDMNLALMKQMARHTEIGFAVSMTSTLTRNPTPDTFYFDAQTIIQQALTLTNRYKLDHSYLPNDFTIYCYLGDFFSN